MNCKLIKNYTIDFIEGNLSGELQLEISDHLKHCPKCSMKISQIAESWNEVTRKETIEAPSFFLSKVYQKINQPETSKISFKRLFGTFQRLYVPAMSTAILLIGLIMGHYFGGFLYQSTGAENYANFEEKFKTEIAEVVSMTSLDDFQSESLAEIYLELE